MADNADRAQENDERVMRRFENRAATVHDLRVSTDCMDCGDAIEAERIKLMPYATRCAECQQWHESKQKLEAWRG